MNAERLAQFSAASMNVEDVRVNSRGKIVEEFFIPRRVIVLNEPSEWYTSSGANGQSDIDVTWAWIE